MRIKGIYENLELELKKANITRTILVKEKVFNFGINTITRKLAGETSISLKEAIALRDYIQQKTGNFFTLEYLFRKE